MRRYSLLMLLLAAFLSGCLSAARAIPPSPEKTPIETLQDDNARLATQLDAVTEVNHKIAYDLEVTRIELEKCKAALAAEGKTPAETVPAFRDYLPDHIKFGMLTGPSNWTGGADYDGIAAYLLIKDSEGTTLKSKGNVVFDLLDISQRRQDIVMSWAVPAEVLSSTWQSLPPGNRMKLPWKGPVPWGDDVVFRATFTDAYGKQHTTSMTFTLKHQGKYDYPNKDGKGRNE